MDFQQIIYVQEGHRATITLNRPGKLNAYSEVMVHEIIAALGQARDDNAVRVVILTGAGRGFCSGGDISRDFQYPARYHGHRLEAMLEMRENMHQLVTLLRRFDKPTIAAINGPAVAGGLTLALCCDFRIAARGAKLGDTSLRFGLIPDEGGRTCFRNTWACKTRCGCRCCPKSIRPSRRRSWDWSPKSSTTTPCWPPWDNGPTAWPLARRSPSAWPSG